ncbi:MAG TPA: aspartate kinase, partial [Planctomycetota bacterium]|nr:aspartate kinase [Planctomycetota bacterium]
MKFGGTSVADAGSIRQVAAIVQQQRQRRPVVVVSAHAGVTDALLLLAATAPAGDAGTDAIAVRHRQVLAELDLPTTLLDPLLAELADLVRGIRLVGEASAKATDHLASFGERLSARTVAACFTAAGMPATAVDAWDLGLRTDGSFGRARPLPDDGTLAGHLARVPGLPVVTGFIAKDLDGNITTLGRNGSDYTAALVGAAAGVEEIQVWKDVDGVRTADPRLVAAALPIRTMSFDEACELASFGSKVLHPATMLPAMRRGIAVCVRSTLDPASPGTRIVAGLPPSGQPVRAIAHRRPVALLTLASQRLLPQHTFLAKVFDTLAAHAVDVGPVTVSEGSLAFAADSDKTDALLPDLRGLGDVRIERDQAVVGVVGEGLALAHGAAAVVLETLAAAGVAVRCAAQGARANTL